MPFAPMKHATPLLTGKAYSVAQAARLAGTSAQNVRRWLHGYTAPGHKMKPVFKRRPSEEDAVALSFLELAEVTVVARFRKGSGKRIPLERLRSANQFARDRLHIDYPFASRLLKVQGGHIMHDFEEANPGPGKLAIDVAGNYVLPFDLGDALDMFDFDPASQTATRWYPAGKDVPVVILEPGRGAGWPIVAGSNVRTEVLHARWKDGWTIDQLAEDFELEKHVVEAVLQAAA